MYIFKEDIHNYIVRDYNRYPSNYITSLT